MPWANPLATMIRLFTALLLCAACQAGAQTPSVRAPAAVAFKAYSAFDFVPGARLIADEDFSQDRLGDFPARWNTNAGGEVVHIEGRPGQWLKLPDRGLVFPEFVQALPEQFTLEFDMLISDDLSDNLSGLRVHFPALKDRGTGFDADFGSTTQVGFDLHPLPRGTDSVSHAWAFDRNGQRLIENSLPIAWKVGAVNRVSISRQGPRVRLYLNQSKVWDLPRAFDAGVVYSLLFSNQLFAGATFVGQLRIAVGAPEARQKLITDGRWVTRGILFDVNADRIRPESYAVLKDIAAVLGEHPAVQVLIVGHTDSDGDDARNLDLSRRRAEAVRTALAGEFGIAAARMGTEGRGETQPAEPNTSPQAKANNRRVEFVRR